MENILQEVPNENDSEDKTIIQFHHSKSPLFRTIHVDGVVGNVTPHLDIYMSLYNEREPLPKRTAYFVEKDGSLGEEARDFRESKEGFVRELEIGAVISVETAIAIRNWLDKAIRVALNITEDIEMDE